MCVSGLTFNACGFKSVHFVVLLLLSFILVILHTCTCSFLSVLRNPIKLLF